MDADTSRPLARFIAWGRIGIGVSAVVAPTLSARPWVALGGMADAVDAMATVLAFGSLPRRSRWGILAVTVGAAVVSIRAAAALDTEAPSVTPPAGATSA